MSVEAKQKPKVGALVPTSTTGIYYRLKANGKKTFYVRFTKPDGKRTFEAVGSFEEAKGRLAEVQGKIKKREVIGSTTTTVADVIAEWQAIRNVKPRTREMQDTLVRLYIRPPLGRVRVRDITRGSVVKLLAGLKRNDGRDGPLSEGTKTLVLATLSSILELAVDDELIASNPCKALSRKQRPPQGKIADRVLAPGELDRLLAACERFTWLRPIILTTLHGGLRLGEVVGLDWRDIDFERNVIVVRQNFGKDGRLGTPKGGRVEEIPFLPDARRALAKHKLAADDTSPDAPVFVNQIGTRRRGAEVTRAFLKARRYAALSTEPRPFRFHDLRHSAITALANAPGAVLPEVQAFARHATMATTLDYVHRSPGTNREKWTTDAGAAMEAALA